MNRALIAATLLLSTSLITGCAMTGQGTSSNGQTAQSATPGLAAQSSILALQTWLMIQQGKASGSAEKLAASNPAEAERQRARAASAGNIMTSLGALRTESNCSRRLQLATAAAGGLQAEFPTYQTELGLGTNLVTVLVSGMPGCQ